MHNIQYVQTSSALLCRVLSNTHTHINTLTFPIFLFYFPSFTFSPRGNTQNPFLEVKRSNAAHPSLAFTSRELRGGGKKRERGVTSALKSAELHIKNIT